MRDGEESVKLETLIAYLAALGNVKDGKVYVNYEIQRTIDRIEERIDQLERQ